MKKPSKKTTIWVIIAIAITGFLAIANKNTITKYEIVLPTNRDFYSSSRDAVLQTQNEGPEYLTVFLFADGELYNLLHKDGVFYDAYFKNICGRILHIYDDGSFDMQHKYTEYHFSGDGEARRIKIDMKR